ncbi:hypothetical protein LTR56_018125 [Elasticomyces elasticus]|nr:hypothetical protein LTR56_018125 [Elasticomyces elasticus]KAK3642538.1 hypothetical protein LTR22_016073 [Elasticomyces elasticus]KAK4906213.1 hypothetical protein LTR49_024614 [Elasticomyces elasticus]KAK5758031.1 hypothetical protein LTS12_011926 [Elasticomyces elasticus]
MSTDKVSESFNRAFAVLHQLFEDDKIVECVELAQDLLEESAIPRYHRIKILITLSSAVADWRDAEACRREAEQLWSLSRDFHPPGEDPSVDEALAHLRLCLDSCNEILQKEKPEYDAEMLRLEVERDAKDMEEVVATPQQERTVEAQFDDPVELAKAEADDEEELARGDELAIRQKDEASRSGAKDTGTSFISSSARAMAPFVPPSRIPKPKAIPGPVTPGRAPTKAATAEPKGSPYY